MKRIAHALILTAFFIGCAKVPVTGRRQLKLVPESTLVEMAAEQYRGVLDSSRLSNDASQVQMVKTVGKKIQVAVEKYMRDNGNADQLKGYNWEFNLIQEDVANAWAMPGGKVAFYTGIMPICKDDEGVAVVMGHEIAHAIARHGNERMSQGLAAQFGGSALSAALQTKPAATQNLFMQAYGISTQVGVLLRFSRKQESEADEIGLIFMAMAGYNPEEAVKFWERMAKLSGGSQPPEFLSTHPSHDTRIADLKKQMPNALKYYTPPSGRKE